MIAPSKRVVVWALGKHALGALGAFAIIAGAIVAVRDLGAGLALVTAGAGLLGICWGLSGRSRRAAQPTMPFVPRSTLPGPSGEPRRLAELPGGIGAPRAA